jgi:hypothetical protein
MKRAPLICKLNRTPDWGVPPADPLTRGYRPHIPVLSALCPQLNLFKTPTPAPNKIPGYATVVEPSVLASGVGIDLPDILFAIPALELWAFDRHFDENLSSGCAGHLAVMSSLRGWMIPVRKLLMYAAECRSTWVGTGRKPTSVFLDQWPLISVREFVNKMDVCVILIREQCFFYRRSRSGRSFLLINDPGENKTTFHSRRISRNFLQHRWMFYTKQKIFTASALVLCSAGMGDNYVEVERINTWSFFLGHSTIGDVLSFRLPVNEKC